MAQSRPSYTYNPDLPTRKWHQKWINPMISLQNAPPTSHGTPAPTKEDGEAGHAGFRVRAWIPMDEDDDVTDEMLQQEADWWSKPGAPPRPDATSKEKITTKSVAPAAEDNSMQIDPPNETAVATNGVSADVPPPSVSAADPPKAPSPIASPNKSPPRSVDIDMPDANSSPVHLPTVAALSHSPQPSPSAMQLQSPLPLQTLPTESVNLEESSNPAIIPAIEASSTEDVIMQSQSSPPSDPLIETREVAPGPLIDTPNAQSGNMDDVGSITSTGGGAASDGIVSGETVDLQDAKETTQEAIAEGKPDEETVSQEARVDTDAETTKDETLE